MALGTFYLRTKRLVWLERLWNDWFRFHSPSLPPLTITVFHSLLLSKDPLTAGATAITKFGALLCPRSGAA